MVDQHKPPRSIFLGLDSEALQPFYEHIKRFLDRTLCFSLNHVVEVSEWCLVCLLQAGADDLMQQAQTFSYANGSDHPPTAINLEKSLLRDLFFNQSPAKVMPFFSAIYHHVF